MLNARAYSLRQKSRLAISLSWIAGYTNVVSLIHCGVMTSHVTGNVTHFGQHLSELSDHPERALVPAGYCLFLIFSFFSGAIASGIMMQTAQRNRVRSQYITPIAVEALLLLLFSIGMTFQPSGSMSIAAVYVLRGLRVVRWDYRTRRSRRFPVLSSERRISLASSPIWGRMLLR